MSQTCGSITKTDTSTPGTKKYSKTNWVEEHIDYVNGCVTVTFQSNYYTVVPTVTVGVTLKNLAYSTNIIINPIITTHTTSGLTIRVNVNNNGTIAEASTDDVIVSIFAIK